MQASTIILAVFALLAVLSQSHGASLPQNDKDPAKRAEEVAEKKKTYKYTADETGPNLDGLPKSEDPTPIYEAQLAASVARLLLNACTATPCVRENLPDLICDIDATALPKGRARPAHNKSINPYRLDVDVCPWPDYDFGERPKSIEAYDEYFPLIKKPSTLAEHDIDEAFVRYRLAGPNPLALSKCTVEDLARFNLEASDLQNLTAIAKDGRLWIEDYSALANFTAEPYKEANKTNAKPIPRYTDAPMALFETPQDAVIRKREGLVPMLIQLTPDKAGLIVKPNQGYLWQIAKAFVNSAYVTIHEAFVHLTHTHLVVEAVLPATLAQFADEHPLFQLLDAHMEGTASINQNAFETLVSVGGDIDVLMAPNINETRHAIGKEVYARVAKNFSFPSLLAAQGLDEYPSDAYYPYRDDGTLVWNAIHAYVTDYISRYYKSSDDISNDFELQGWINMARSGGRVAWFNSWDNSTDTLVDYVASIIWTASAQHAAVNYPQTMLSFVPSFPASLFQPVPTNTSNVTHQHFLDTMPPLDLAKKQVFLSTLLASVYYSKLGRYGWLDSKFAFDEAQKEADEAFDKALKEIEREIEQRNLDRINAWKTISKTNLNPESWAYETLLPSKIPQSIHI